jgi:hypothetical protein
MVRVAIRVLAVILATASPLLAQRTTGEITGTVTDGSGGVLPGVTVTLFGAALPAAGVSSVSTETGNYRFPALAPGTYDVEATLQGFSTLRREGLSVGVGATISVDLALAVGSLNETVTVTGDAPLVNVATSQVSTNYNKEWVQSAPLRRFSFFDLINSSPGVSQTTSTSSGSTNATSLGSSVNDNSYQIDGTDLSAPGAGGGWAWPNTDAIEEIQVLQLGASAEYGNVQGAVFNVVTRQGGNEFHGDANFYYINDALTGRNTTPAEDNGLPYYRKTFRDTTFQLSGPVMRDRLWFFGSYQYQNSAESQPGFARAAAVDNIGKRIFYKLNYNITPNHRLMHGFHDDFWKLPPSQANPLVALSTLSTSGGDNPAPNIVYDGVLSNRTYVEARFSGYFGKDSNTPYIPGQLPGIPQVTNLDTSEVSGGVTSFNTNKSWRKGASIKLSHVAESFLGGNHDIKAGLQYNGGGADQLRVFNDTLEISRNTAFGTTQQPFHQGGLIRTTGAYVDDTIRLKRVTVNAGLRFDHSRTMFKAFPVLDQFARQTGELSPANDDLYTWNVWSPRVGINWQLTGSGNTVLKAHYGRYYRGPLLDDFTAASPSVTPQYSFALDAAGNRTNVQVNSSNTNLRVDPDFKDPYTDQYIIQLEQQLVADLGLQVNYVHKSGQNYPGWVDTTGRYREVPYLDNVGADATGGVLMVQQLLTPSSESLFLMTNPEGMHTKYDGATFVVNKRMSNRWQGTLSLVLSRSEGRLASSTQAPTAGQSQTSAMFGRFPNGPNDFINSDGRLIADRPVVAKAQIVYQFPWGLMVSTNIQHQTGRPWTRQVRIGGLGFPAPVMVLAERIDGSRRVDDLNLVDIRAQKSINLGATRKADLFVDFLNIANTGAAEGVLSRLGTAATYGARSSFTFPRRAMIGAKFRF